MSLTEALGIAWRALRGNGLRSGLTMLGIIVGVGAVVCMASIGEGAQAQITEKIRRLGANLLYVSPGEERAGAAKLEAGSRHTLTEDDAAAILRELPHIAAAAPLVNRPLQLVAGNRNRATLVVGNNSDYLVAKEWPLAVGRTFSAQEIEAGAKVAIIGQVVAKELFDGNVALGDSLRIGSIPFSVIGVLAEKGEAASGRSQDDIVLIPLSTARSRVLAGGKYETNRRAVDYILIKHGDGPVAEFEKQITELLVRRHRLREDQKPDFTIFNPLDVLTTQQATARSFGMLLAAIASVSLVVGGISIMNIMLVSVAERTREVGLRMAVGARRRDVRNQFLIESVLLALFGGLLGTIAGAICGIGLAAYADWPVLISPSAVVLACLVAGCVGIVFGYYPAYRASRLEPIVALRFE